MIRTGSFRDRDQSVVVFERQGVYRASGSTLNRGSSAAFETCGIGADQVSRDSHAAANRGGDGIGFEVVHPVTGVVDEETSYTLPLGEERLIGCGVVEPKGGHSLQA